MIAIYKRLGETPLQALERFKKEKPELAKEPLSYAGRLDPMAEGVLLVLVGEENLKENREKYLNLDKTYETEILFGIETDTLDILGKVLNEPIDTSYLSKLFKQQEQVNSLLQEFYGEHEWLYPAFSSKPVNGKPLFRWARENKLHEIKIPTRIMTIFSLNVVESKIIPAPNLLENIQEKIKKVIGDFRQEEILKLWEKGLTNDNQNFFTIKLTIHCSSGTYIRTFAHELGKKLSLPALALSIKRIQVGEYSILP